MVETLETTMDIGFDRRNYAERRTGKDRRGGMDRRLQNGRWMLVFNRRSGFDRRNGKDRRYGIERRIRAQMGIRRPNEAYPGET